ncbi:DUF4232 domain-containing protein [Catenulispora subtropica]
MNQLSVTEGHGGAASGLEVVPLLFRNTGTTTCRLQGYPELAAADSSGKQIFSARQTPRGPAGGLAAGDSTPPAVDLKPGQTASALWEWEAPATSKNLSCAAIGSVRQVQISLPASPGQTTLSWNISGSCSDDLQVNPFVPGTTGRQGGN